MKAINTKYKVTAEVLTPLSIGQGAENDWVYGVDYLVQSAPNNPKQLLLYHLDLNKMVAAGINIGVLSNYLSANNVQGVLNLLKNSLKKVSDFCIPLPDGIGLNGLTNPIKTFLRNDLTNHPVLAGSSLKGALRSILFTYLRTNEKDNASVFGNMKDGNDFMRFVRVGDFEFAETCLVNTKIYNLTRNGKEWKGGWKLSGGRKGQTVHEFKPIGFNTIYECLPPQIKADAYMLFAENLFAKVAAQGDTKKKKEILNDVEILCDKINDHTYNYLNKEIEFFNKYDKAERCSDITNSISKIKDVIASCASNECVLKMSAGSGFHSITGDWQYEYYYEYKDGKTGKRFLLDRKKREGQFRANDLPKSRKIAVSGSRAFSLMGFVKLTFTKE